MVNNIGPAIGPEDEFEQFYTERFRTLVSPHGVFIKYERDRAALDIGLHLTSAAGAQRRVSLTRIWFQLRGVQKSTFSAEEYDRASTVKLRVDLADLKFWFASPEPVYLAHYVEAKDLFLVKDVRDLVYAQWGDEFLSPGTFKPNQQTVNVVFSKESVLTAGRLVDMRRHQSMRIDGPFFRGRPLGHRLDPLRCIPEQLAPETFVRLVQRLLEVHDYRVQQSFDPGTILAPDSGQEHAALSIGRLYNTFEWVPQLFTEFGVGPKDDFRDEGTPEAVHGTTAVFIHGDSRSAVDSARLTQFIAELQAAGVSHLLVFANTDEMAYIGRFSAAVRGTGVRCLPQRLSDLAYSLLTATVVYLEFRDAIRWKLINYL
jgi:hypothetical protein